MEKTTDQLMFEFQQMIDSKENGFGDFIVKIGKSPQGSIILYFKTIFSSSGSYKDKKVLKNNKVAGTICDVCSHKLPCLLLEGYNAEKGKCFENPLMRKGIVKEVEAAYQLNHPRKEVEEFLAANGFTEVSRTDQDLSIHGRENALAYIL